MSGSNGARRIREAEAANRELRAAIKRIQARAVATVEAIAEATEAGPERGEQMTESTAAAMAGALARDLRHVSERTRSTDMPKALRELAERAEKLARLLEGQA